jgi:hypothetical protein
MLDVPPTHPDHPVGWGIKNQVSSIGPLDFLVVSDHAENLGLAPAIEESNPELLKGPWGKKVCDTVKAGDSPEVLRVFVADSAVTVAGARGQWLLCRWPRHKT